MSSGFGVWSVRAEVFQVAAVWVGAEQRHKGMAPDWSVICP